MTIKTGHKRRKRAERTTTKSLGRFFPGLNAREIDHQLNQVYGRHRSRRPRTETMAPWDAIDQGAAIPPATVAI